MARRRRDCRLQITGEADKQNWRKIVKKYRQKAGLKPQKKNKSFDFSFLRAVQTLDVDPEVFAKKLKCYKMAENGMQKLLKLMAKCKMMLDKASHDKLLFVNEIMGEQNGSPVAPSKRKRSVASVSNVDLI